MNRKPFVSSSEYVKLRCDGFGEMFKNIIMDRSNIKLVPLKSLKFQQSKKYEKNWENLDYQDMITRQIRPIDYMLYHFIKKHYNKSEINISYRDEDLSYTEEFTTTAIFYAYFMKMTREKIKLIKDEKLPKFLSKICSESDVENYYLALSDNDLEMMDHSWIFELDVSGLGKETKSRFLKGIAGTRLMQAICRYKIRDDVSTITKKLVDNLRSKLTRNIYKECHPLGQPDYIRNISLGKNLNNFILEYYDEKEIKMMVDEKLFTEYPKQINGFNHYLTWDENFFNYLETELSIGGTAELYMERSKELDEIPELDENRSKKFKEENLLVKNLNVDKVNNENLMTVESDDDSANKIKKKSGRPKRKEKEKEKEDDGNKPFE